MPSLKSCLLYALLREYNIVRELWIEYATCERQVSDVNLIRANGGYRNAIGPQLLLYYISKSRPSPLKYKNISVSHSVLD